LQVDALLPLINAPRSRFRLTPEVALIRPLNRDEQDDPLAATQAILRQLVVAASADRDRRSSS